MEQSRVGKDSEGGEVWCGVGYFKGYEVELFTRKRREEGLEKAPFSEIFGVQDLLLLVATKQEGARGIWSTWSGSIWRRTDWPWTGTWCFTLLAFKATFYGC